MPAGRGSIRQLARLRALSPAERRDLLAAAAWLPLFWLGLRVFGLARFKARLDDSRVTVQEPVNAGQVRALGDLVNIAARHTPFPVTCLTRSLLLQWLLRRRGVDSQLRIGVRLIQGSLDAHAWVECDGVPVNDKPDVASQFAPFGDSVPASAFNTRARGAP